MTPVLEKKIEKSLKKNQKLGLSPKGEYGFYVKVNSRYGIKFVGMGYDTKEEVMERQAYKLAKEEAALLQEASSRCDFIPKCYGVVVAFFREAWRAGIVMKHLGKKRLGDVYLRDWKIDRVRFRLKEKMAELGIVHRDLHGGNVMRHAGKWWAIDFTPEFVWFDTALTDYVIPCSY